jgi:hypothetical protein
MDGTYALPAQAASFSQEGLHSELSYKRLEAGRFDPARLGGGSIAMSELVAWLEGIDLSRVRRLRAVDVSVVA